VNKNALFLFNVDSTLYSMWDKKESLTTFLRQNSMFYLGIINGLEKMVIVYLHFTIQIFSLVSNYLNTVI
jgi:hypothetical protein